MPITFIKVDGVHVAVQATLAQIAQDQELLLFADGLIPKSVALLGVAEQAQWTIAQALWQDNEPIRPLLTALLALDAEIVLHVRDEQRTIPLPGFLSYRTHFLPGQATLNMVRLPPLNPNGHYLFASSGNGSHIAMRLDIHPKLRVCGHVRFAIGGPDRPPQRIQALEHRLERQALTPAIINEANTHLPVALGEDEKTLIVTKLLALCAA